MSLLLALTLGAAPFRLVQSIQGVPVGTVQVAIVDGQLVYEASHLFRDESARFSTAWPVDAEGRDAQGLVGEVWFLSKRPKRGCATVREERTRNAEQVCIDDGERVPVRGTLAGLPFVAGYSKDGTLGWLELLGKQGEVLSRFERSDARVDGGGDPFSAGFVVRGSPGPGRWLGLDPVDEGAIEVQVEGVAAEEVAEDRCVTASQRLVRQRPGARLQLGLVLEAGRAWPHAFVRLEGGRFVDPTMVRGEDRLARRRYLTLPTERAGQRYLELAAGARRVAWGRR